MSHDIFVSHANDNKPVANNLCVELEEKGLDVWIAPRDITAGQNWMEAISKAILDSKAMVLVMGEEASKSDEIQKEIRLADDYNIPTIPVTIKGVEPPHEYRYLLAGIQRLSVNPPLTEGDYNRIIQAIISNTELTVDTSEIQGDGQVDERTDAETDVEERTDEHTAPVAIDEDTDTTIESDQDRRDYKEDSHSEPETNTGPKTGTEEADELVEERTIKIEDWHDLHAIRENLDADYELVNDLHRYTPGYDEHVGNPSAGWEPIGDMATVDIDKYLEKNPKGFRQMFFEAVMGKLTEEELSELERADITEVGEEVTEKILKEALVEVAIEFGVNLEENQGKTSGETYEAIEEFLQRKIEYINMGEIERKASQQAGFSGSFDGNGYDISDLTIDRPDEDCVGLFAATIGAILTEVKIKNARINGGDLVGGLVGLTAAEAEIREAKIESDVDGANIIGGLVGGNTDGAVVADSTADGEINGANTTGGLVGGNIDGAVVADSTAEGTVDGDDIIGGLVGNNQNEAVVRDSTAESDVDGGYSIGGLVGVNTEEAVVRDSTAECDIGGTQKIGGLVGRNSDNAVVRNSTAESSISEKYRDIIGGLVGLNTGACIQDSESRSDIEGSEKVGGLVGVNKDGAIVQGSSADGTVDGDEMVGGLVGMNEDEAVVEDSTAESTVEGNEDTGRQ